MLLGAAQKFVNSQLEDIQTRGPNTAGICKLLEYFNWKHCLPGGSPRLSSALTYLPYYTYVVIRHKRIIPGLDLIGDLRPF